MVLLKAKTETRSCYWCSKCQKAEAREQIEREARKEDKGKMIAWEMLLLKVIQFDEPRKVRVWKTNSLASPLVCECVLG